MSWTPPETADIKRAIWAESGGRIAGGSGSSPLLRCRRILSKQGMECTPVFHNLFPHSSPLHVYKQNPEERGKGGGKRVGDRGGDVHGSPGNMSGQDSLAEQKGKENEL